MIEPYILPPEQLKDCFDLEEAYISLAMKVNEIINEINGPEEGGNTFEDDLYKLIDTWKEEAAELMHHPENFQGFTIEVCTAIARNKIHCCSELLKLVEEHQ